MAFGNESCKEIVENVCPYCGQTLLMNKRSFANHVRWCKFNPKYEQTRSNMIEKIKCNAKQKRDKTLKEYKVNCSICKKEYIIICSINAFNSGKYRKTCSSECAHKLTQKNLNNTLKYKKISKTLTHKPIIKICPYCGIEFETKRKHKKYCSRHCAAKARYSDNRSLKNIYKGLCGFTFALNDYCDEFDFSLIEKFGWYKAKNHGNNLNGISRDHMLSCNFGYENLIDPYLVSHPANCMLLQHNKNVSKYTKCSITIDQLIERIKIWHLKYGVYKNIIDYTYFDKNNIKLQYRDILLN